MMRSEGARLLAATGLDHAAIAAEIGVGRTSVTQWLSGDKNPSAARRKAIAEAYGVPPSAWDRRAGESLTPAAGSGGASDSPSMASGASAGAGAVFDARAGLEGQIARLDKIRAEGEQPGADFPPQARLRLEATYTRCLELLGRMNGDSAEIGETKIVRLPAWRRIQEAIIAALRPYPEAAAAVADALKELGA